MISSMIDTDCFGEIVDLFEMCLKMNDLYCKVTYDPSQTVFKRILLPNESPILVPQDEFVCIETDLHEKDGDIYHVFVKHAGKYYYSKFPKFHALVPEPIAFLHEVPFIKLVTIAPLEIHRWKHPEYYRRLTMIQMPPLC